MKTKLFTLFLALAAALMSVSVFAANPAAADLAGFQEAGYYVACFSTPDPGTCNDIVWIGTYDGWNAADPDKIKCEELTGFPGWYVAKVPVTFKEDGVTPDNCGKPVQLNECGKFDWAYQCGKYGTIALVSGHVDINSDMEGAETKLENWSTTEPTIVTMSAWKASPCENVCDEHSYEIRLFDPFCESHTEFLPYIRGNFNAWGSAVPMTLIDTVVDGDDASVYVYKTDPLWGNLWMKWNNSPEKDNWSNQFQVYIPEDTENDVGAYWTDLIPDGFVSNADISTMPYVKKINNYTFEFDLSDNTKYRYGQCEIKYPSLNLNCDENMGIVSQRGLSTTFIITASPKYGYHFVQWNDGNTDNPRTIILTQDTTFTAEFAKNEYTIVTESSNGAWGTTAGGTAALYLDKVQISATANYGYHFVQWDDGNTTNPRTITVTENKTYQATFAKNVYYIDKITNSTQGYISGASQAEYLNSVTLSAIPNSGYKFTKWSDGIMDNPRTFVITRDTTFFAEFALITSGQCGDELFWTYRDGQLSFYGTGDMYNYTTSSLPWKQFLTEITTVIFGQDLTSIGNYACANMTNLQQINIPTSVQSIGNYAFAYINNRNISNLVLPSEIKTIGAYAFANDTYIEQIDFGKSLESIGEKAFDGCIRVLTMTCLATVTPDVGTDALTSISDYAELYVLSSVLRKYQVNPNWNRFLLKELGATEMTTTQDSVVVEPTDNTAVVTWPISDNATSYTIEITKDGIVVCTLIFNANGQLIGIAFAPSKDGLRKTRQATLTANGMQFTITGLNSGTHYTFTLQAKDDQNTVVASYAGEFTTTGESQVPTGIDDMVSSSVPQKVVKDGQIFIFRGDKVYTVTGQEVK